MAGVNALTELFYFTHTLQSMFEEKFITAHLAKKFQNDLFRNFTPKSTILSVKNSDDLFSSLPHFTDCPALTPKFSPHEFLNNLCLGFYLNFTFFLSKILMTFFQRPFLYDFLPFRILFIFYITDDSSYSYFLHTIHLLYTHLHSVFRFLHLALCSRNS